MLTIITLTYIFETQLGIRRLSLFAGILDGKMSAKATCAAQIAYGKAGAVAAEVLSLIRTVTAFSGKQRELKRYERELEGVFLNVQCYHCLNALGWVVYST